MVNPSDQSARDRFAEELDRNFSVVASAGSGKTRAITERILEIARPANAAEILPQLVVVTFTNRAADEMQQRTRQQILEENLPARSERFQPRLLRHDPRLLHEAADQLWPLSWFAHAARVDHRRRKSLAGICAATDPARGVVEREESRRAFPARPSPRHHGARRAAPAPRFLRPGEIGPVRRSISAEVHARRAKGSGHANIINSKAELADWEERYNADWEFLRWPICSTQREGILERWREAFAPLAKMGEPTPRSAWPRKCNAIIAISASNAAWSLTPIKSRSRTNCCNIRPRPAACASKISASSWMRRRTPIPRNFPSSSKLTRPPDATGRWMETRTDPPRPGHFCMVGDLQQSIYGDRADLQNYRARSRALVTRRGGEELTFSVTFRLDQKQLRFIN